HGGVTPILSPSELQEMGFAAAIYPTVGLFAASHALASVYQALAQGKPVSDPLYAFGDFVDMIGFSKVWDFEQKYADLLAEDQIQSTHGKRRSASQGHGCVVFGRRGHDGGSQRGHRRRCQRLRAQRFVDTGGRRRDYG